MTLVHCSICVRRVLAHAYSLTCALCRGKTHVKCLPYADQTDFKIAIDKYLNWHCANCMNDMFPFNNVVDNNELKRALFSNEFNNMISADDLNREYSTEDLSPDLDMHNMEVDPDLNYFNELQCDMQSKYFNENSFNEKCKTLGLALNILSIMHLNIRSAVKHMDDFEIYLKNLDHNFAVIALSETWFNETNVALVKKEGYKHFYKIRNVRKGGGVSIFVKDILNVKERDDLNVNDDCMESVFIEVNNIVIGSVYRPPNTNMDRFTNCIEKVMSQLKRENKLCYIAGDYNINLLNVDTHMASSVFLELLYSYGFFPMISKPTRIVKENSTLIDNIFTNDVLNDSTSGIMCSDISDHFPIFAICQKKLLKLQEGLQLRYERSYCETNINRFMAKSMSLEWQNVIEDYNCQSAYSLFHNNLEQCFDDCFPLRKVEYNYKNKKKWLSKGLKLSIKAKNKLYVRSLKHPSCENVKKYKMYRNKLHQLLRKAERDHYDALLNHNKNNLRKSWSIIKEVINKKRQNCISHEFLLDGDIVTDRKCIAHKFNEFFTNIGSTLANKIAKSDIDPVSYIKNANKHSMVIEPTDTVEVSNIIRTLRDASAGFDNITAKIVKLSCDTFLAPLTHVLNLSLTQGIVPNELKIAKVLPLFKSGNAMLINNYRPISILPVFSKVLEKLMYNRLMSFINKHNILYKYQFGFRKNYGTNLALICVLDKVLNALEKGDIVLGVFLDFSKAFDTVDHDILLKKLYKYGIRGLPYEWIKSYLYNRKQFVSYNNYQSDSRNVVCGVPQGSILGPLLFLLYVNDIVNASTVLLPFLFADDTNVFFHGKDKNELAETVNNELSKVVEWLKANKLSLNVNKTNYMLFSLGTRDVSFPNDIKINGTIIQRVKSTKFLGVIIDQHLNWSEHIMCVKRKIAKGIGILFKARKVLPMTTVHNLYYTFVYPHLVYCIEIWGSASDCYLSQLFKLQKRVVRLLTSSGYRDHSADLFKKTKVLSIYQIYKCFLLQFMFKFHRGMLPISLYNSMFELNTDVHNYNTRQRGNLHIPRFKHTALQKSIRYQGVKLWNEAKKKLEINCSFSKFKHQLKPYLIEIIL